LETVTLNFFNSSAMRKQFQWGFYEQAGGRDGATVNPMARIDLHERVRAICIALQAPAR
jgi:hypothetical protein